MAVPVQDVSSEFRKLHLNLPQSRHDFLALPFPPNELQRDWSSLEYLRFIVLPVVRVELVVSRLVGFVFRMVVDGNFQACWKRNGRPVQAVPYSRIAPVSAHVVSGSNARAYGAHQDIDVWVLVPVVEILF